MTLTHLTNARIVDGTAPEPTEPMTVVLEGDAVIREVSPSPAPHRRGTGNRPARPKEILMPGLIDCHVHRGRRGEPRAERHAAATRW